jgi:pyruvate/2-oxoglutarate/acetoin dehydrogenase E1 component
MTTFGQSINHALHRLLAENIKVLLLGEDIRDPYGGAFKITRGLSKKFSERVINTPISESAITGIGTGLAMNGFLPIVEIMFGDFLTLCCDQIVNHASKFRWMFNDKVSVPLIIRTPMGGYRGYGPTHSQTLEKIFLGIPGIEIVAPSLFHNPGNLLKYCVAKKEFTLFVENKVNYPKELIDMTALNEYDCKVIGECNDQTVIIKNKNQEVDVTLLCYGGMASFAQEAASEVFLKEEIASEVIIPSRIKPLNLAPVVDSIDKSGRLIVIEEGTLENGWGSEIVAKLQNLLFGKFIKPISRVAGKNMPIGNAVTIERDCLPTKETIKLAIMDLFQ